MNKLQPPCTENLMMDDIVFSTPVTLQKIVYTISLPVQVYVSGSLIELSG